MAAIGIEAVDAAVVAARDGALLAASPGVAVLAAGGPVVGAAAAAALRLQPVLAADRFWSDLSQDALAGAGGESASHADLVHSHLGALWKAVAAAGDEAVFAVPGSMRPRRTLRMQKPEGLPASVGRESVKPLSFRRSFPNIS